MWGFFAGGGGIDTSRPRGPWFLNPSMHARHVAFPPLYVHGHGTHGETHQVERVEAYLREDDAVSPVGVKGGGLDVGPVKVPQVQGLLAVLVAEDDQGAHERVFGRATDCSHRAHLVEVQQEAGVVLSHGDTE